MWRLVTMAVFVLTVAMGSTAEAQLPNREARGGQGVARPAGQSGARSGGQTGGSQLRSAEETAQITGNERFVRDARDANAFVGADSRELAGFVGSTAGSVDGEIRSAIEGNLVREAIAPAINRMLNMPQLRTGMYAPRLKLGFVPTMLPGPAIETDLSQRLSLSSVLHPTRPIRVSMDGRTATVSGTVASEHEKKLAGLLLLFEPGISTVDNDLLVQSPQAAAPTAER